MKTTVLLRNSFITLGALLAVVALGSEHPESTKDNLFTAACLLLTLAILLEVAHFFKREIFLKEIPMKLMELFRNLCFVSAVMFGFISLKIDADLRGKTTAISIVLFLATLALEFLRFKLRPKR